MRIEGFTLANQMIRCRCSSRIRFGEGHDDKHGAEPVAHEWVCKYHIALALQYIGIEIIEGYLMPAHVQMLTNIPPKLAVSSSMEYQGKSALILCA